MLRPGQRHVEQAQVFGQALIIGTLHLRFTGLQHHLDAPLTLDRQGLVALGDPGIADERQEHQGIFQPLGFMDGDHLDQGGVALQSQHLFLLGVITGADHQLLEVADQCLLAIQFPCALL